MALTYTWYPPFPAPANFTAQLQDGGSLAANTTYKYIVMAMRVIDGKHKACEGLPSQEIMVTTDDVNRTVYLSWDAVPDATGYVVHRRTASQTHYDSYSAHIHLPSLGTAGWQMGYSTYDTYLTDDGGLSSYWGWPLWAYGGAWDDTFDNGFKPPYWDSTIFPVQPPARGYLRIEADTDGGTITCEDIAANVPDYCYYNGNLFILLANVRFSGSGPIIWNLDRVNAYFAGALYMDNTSAATSITATDSTIWFLGPPAQTSISLERWNFVRSKVLGKVVVRSGLVLRSGNFYIYSTTTARNSDMASLKVLLSEDADIYRTTICQIAPSGRYNSMLGADPGFSGGSVITDSYIYADPFDIWPTYGRHLCVRATSGDSGAVHLTNVHFPDTDNDLPTIRWYYNNPNGSPVYVKYRLDLAVVDAETGAPIEGANVTITNALGETVYQGTTDAEGAIPTQELVRAKLTYATQTSYNTEWHTPHTITISADGYFGETITLTMDNDVEYTAVLKAVEYQEVPVYTPVSEITCTVDASQEIVCTVQAEDTITCEVDA